MDRKKIIKYGAFAILFTFCMEFLGWIFYAIHGKAYGLLEKSSLQPPELVFIVVWTALYALLAASFALVLIKSDGKKGILFLLNGVLTALWTYLYFGQGNVGGALLLLTGIIILAFFLFKTTYDIDKIAAYLLLPYLLWLCFALVILYDVALLN